MPDLLVETVSNGITYARCCCIEVARLAEQQLVDAVCHARDAGCTQSSTKPWKYGPFQSVRFRSTSLTGNLLRL